MRILLIVAGVIVGIIVLFYILLKILNALAEKNTKLNNLVYTDPGLFLIKNSEYTKKAEMKMSIKNNARWTRNYLVLLLNNSSALINNGDWNGAIGVLNDVKFILDSSESVLSEKQYNELYAVYTFNLIYPLLFLNRLSESTEVLSKMDEMIKNNMIDNANLLYLYKFLNKEACAIYEFMSGNKGKSKTMFEEMEKQSPSSFNLGKVDYYLGLIYMDENKNDLALEKLSVAEKAGGKTFFSKKAAEAKAQLV